MDLYFCLFAGFFAFIIIFVIIFDVVSSNKQQKIVQKFKIELENKGMKINHSYKWTSMKTGNVCHFRIINLYYNNADDTVNVRGYLCDNKGQIGLYESDVKYTLMLIDECCNDLVDCGEYSAD